MMESERQPDVPVVLTPDNEPHVGRQALLTFDREIPFSLWLSFYIAAYA